MKWYPGQIEETSLEWEIVVGRRIFTSEHHTVGGDRKAITIMEEPSDGLHEKQEQGRRYGWR